MSPQLEPGRRDDPGRAAPNQNEAGPPGPSRFIVRGVGSRGQRIPVSKISATWVNTPARTSTVTGFIEGGEPGGLTTSSRRYVPVVSPTRKVPSEPEVNRATSEPVGSRTTTVLVTGCAGHCALADTTGHCGSASVIPSIPLSAGDDRGDNGCKDWPVDVHAIKKSAITALSGATRRRNDVGTRRSFLAVDQPEANDATRGPDGAGARRAVADAYLTLNGA